MDGRAEVDEHSAGHQPASKQVCKYNLVECCKTCAKTTEQLWNSWQANSTA